MSTFTILLVLITIVSILLVAVIMIQNPKGGGLDSSLGGGGGSVGGVQNTNKFLDQSTWTLGAILIILILFSGVSFNAGLGNESKIFDEDAAAPAPVENSILPNAEETPAQEAATTPAKTEETTQE